MSLHNYGYSPTADNDSSLEDLLDDVQPVPPSINNATTDSNGCTVIKQERINMLHDMEAHTSSLKMDIFSLRKQFANYSIDESEFHQLTNNVALKGERLVRKLRDFVLESVSPKVPQCDDYYAQVADVLGIHITHHDDSNMVEITIPCIIPRKHTVNTKFITEPLSAVLSSFVTKRHNEDLPAVKFDYCTICVVHSYSKTHYRNTLVRDNDNVELKAITDIISMYLLTDDSGVYCDTFHCCEMNNNETNQTKIFIMDDDMFINWYSRYRKGQKIISSN